MQRLSFLNRMCAQHDEYEYAFGWGGGLPIPQKGVPILSWTLACHKTFLSCKLESRPLSGVGNRSRWLHQGALLDKWGRHYPPGERFETPSGLSKGFSQRAWQFRLNASGVVIWRSRSRTPSFTAQLFGRYANFLHTTWFAYWMESSLSWKPVLCYGEISSLLLCIMRAVVWTTWQHGFHKGEFFLSKTLVACHKQHIKILFERQRLFFGVRQKVNESYASLLRKRC